MWDSEKKRLELKKKHTFSRYIEVLSLNVLVLFLFAGVLFWAERKDFNGFLVSGGITSFLFGLFVFILYATVAPRYTDDTACIKSVYKKNVVYLFEVKDSVVIAGDSKFFSNCENFYLIGLDSFEKPLVSADDDKDFILLKENVNIENNTSKTKNELLRRVAKDCFEKDIPLRTNSKLIVKADMNIGVPALKYEVINGETSQKGTMSMSEADLDDWSGNVLLM